MGHRNAIQAKAETEVHAAAPHRMLIVDDSRLQRGILATTLEGWGFDVVQAASAEEALEHCKHHTFDIVISDWMMPGMSGIEFCQVFREITQDDYGYFILLTSKAEKSEVARGLHSGADDFVSKPVNMNELRARISAGERIVRMQRELSKKNRLVNMTLDELTRVYELLDKDLLEAKKLQQSLLPDRHRVWPEGELSLLLQSAGHVGGDLVGYFPTDDRKLGLFAIDVSGHGISSALMTARLAGYLSAATPDQNVALSRQRDGSYFAVAPKDAVATLNKLVLNEMDTEQYFTLMLAFVDLPTGEVTFAQAGHPHPLIQRAGGQIEQCGEGGFPVGLMSEVRFDEYRVMLTPGDRLVLLSDGVTECPDPAGQLLGDDGLRGIMERLASLKGSALIEGLVWELSAFAGTEEFPDDVSGIVFEYSGPCSGGEVTQE